ncbi:MAG: putative lipoprotein YajG, partial [Bermanella sp.]
MNTKKLVVLAMFVSLLVTGCASAPQMLKVSPILVLDNLQGVTIPVELVISDQRENVNLLGYRTAKNESEIGFSQSVAKSMGES